MLLLAAVTVVLDPIISFDVTAQIFPRITCSAECRVVEVSLRHTTGEVAVFAPGAGCTDTVQLVKVPLGARLVPHVDFLCGGVRRVEVGPAVTVAPYVWNAALDDDHLTVSVYARPRGAELIRVRAIGDHGEVSDTFRGPPFVLRGRFSGRLRLTATLEPYGAVSNTRSLRLTSARREAVWAESSGCGSAALMFPFLLFLRRRFPFPRGFC